MFALAPDPETVLNDVKKLDKDHREQSLLRKVMYKLTPPMCGFEQYTRAMDIYSNAKPEVLGLLWGNAHIVFRVRARIA